MDLKKSMAFGIVERFWSLEAAQQGKDAFEKLFQKKDMSAAQEVVLPADTPNAMTIIDLLRHLDVCQSNSDARRLIVGGGVSIDDIKVTDHTYMVELSKPCIVRAGKHRFYRITK